MNLSRLVVGLGVIFALAACGRDATQVAPPSPPPRAAPGASASAPSASVAPVAPVASGAPVASAPPPEPPKVSCTTEDDCWFDEDHKPIARPAKARGKKIIPCKTGSHSPACVEGVCTVRAWKC